MAKGWAISGISDRTREAVNKAADDAGMQVGEWVEKALTRALKEGLEPGLSMDELVTRLNQVVTEDLRPMQETLARIEAKVTVAIVADGDSPVDSMRERMRQRRTR